MKEGIGYFFYYRFGKVTLQDPKISSKWGSKELIQLLRKLYGVTEIETNTQEGIATIRFDEKVLGVERIISILEDNGHFYTTLDMTIDDSLAMCMG